MRRAQLLNCSLLSSITDNKYMDIDSNSNSYWTEPTVFNSDTDSTAKFKNAYKVSA